MENMKDFAGKAEFREPSRAWTVIEGGSGRDRRLEPLGASAQEGPPDEAHPLQEPIHSTVHPSSARRRSRRGRAAYRVEVVRLDRLPVNRENPYSSVSTLERYGCAMKRMAEIWSSICGSRKTALKAPTERKLAA